MGQLSEPVVMALLERPDLVAELEVARAARVGGYDEIAGRAIAELSEALARPVGETLRRRLVSSTRRRRRAR